MQATQFLCCRNEPNDPPSGRLIEPTAYKPSRDMAADRILLWKLHLVELDGYQQTSQVGKLGRSRNLLLASSDVVAGQPRLQGFLRGTHHVQRRDQPRPTLRISP